jgi:hypothetical protein
MHIFIETLHTDIHLFIFCSYSVTLFINSTGHIMRVFDCRAIKLIDVIIISVFKQLTKKNYDFHFRFSANEAVCAVYMKIISFFFFKFYTKKNQHIHE